MALQMRQAGFPSATARTLSFVGAASQSEAKASEELLEEHEHLIQEARVQVMKFEPAHTVDWGEAQEAVAALAACRMPQVAPSQEGHAAFMAGHLYQKVPRSGG